jgi:DNA-binding NarL/FixJ family response regulator
MSSPLARLEEFGRAEPESILLIERRALVRECLAECLRNCFGYNVLPFASVDECIGSADPISICLVVLCGSDSSDDGLLASQINSVMSWARSVPLVLISEDEDFDRILKTMECGVRGVIPTTLPLAVAGHAMRLVSAGGTFIPATSLKAAKFLAAPAEPSRPQTNGMFTIRQSAVVDALRKGKANKIIAYELNMRESTVKVHVRNIMKKLNARNRTEVAYITNGMAFHQRA